jgi:hypothetical protein
MKKIRRRLPISCSVLREVSTPVLLEIVGGCARRRSRCDLRAGSSRHLRRDVSRRWVQEEDEEDQETFADILQRVARSLDTDAAPHRGTGPPPFLLAEQARQNAVALLDNCSEGRRRRLGGKDLPSIV